MLALVIHACVRRLKHFRPLHAVAQSILLVKCRRPRSAATCNDMPVAHIIVKSTRTHACTYTPTSSHKYGRAQTRARIHTCAHLHARTCTRKRVSDSTTPYMHVLVCLHVSLRSYTRKPLDAPIENDATVQLMMESTVRNIMSPHAIGNIFMQVAWTCYGQGYDIRMLAQMYSARSVKTCLSVCLTNFRMSPHSQN